MKKGKGCMTMMVFAILLLLLPTIIKCQTQESCGRVATEQYLCWQDNADMLVNMNCPLDHMIVVDKVYYIVSDNACPQSGQKPQSGGVTTHCFLSNVTAAMQRNCDQKRICSNSVRKLDATTACSSHSGAHYLDIRYYCIPAFNQETAKEVAMCDTGEWSASYAHILSHSEANQGTFTTDIGCECVIKRNKGTELEIKSLHFESINSKVSDGEKCTQSYVRIMKDGVMALANMCHANDIYWKLGCADLDDIHVQFLSQEKNQGINFKLSVHAAAGHSFSVVCGIPSFPSIPATAASRIATTLATSSRSPATQQPEVTADGAKLFGLSMGVGIAIVALVAIVLVIIVVLAIFFAIRYQRRKQNADAYKDLVEDRASNVDVPPPRPPKGGSGTALPGQGELQMNEFTTSQNQGKGISNPCYNPSPLPGQGEINLSGSNAYQKGNKGMSNGGNYGSPLPGVAEAYLNNATAQQKPKKVLNSWKNNGNQLPEVGEAYMANSTTQQQLKNGQKGWQNKGNQLSAVGELEMSNNSTYQVPNGISQGKTPAGPAVPDRTYSSTYGGIYGRPGPVGQLPEVSEVRMSGTNTTRGSVYS